MGIVKRDAPIPSRTGGPGPDARGAREAGRAPLLSDGGRPHRHRRRVRASPTGPPISAEEEIERVVPPSSEGGGRAAWGRAACPWTPTKPAVGPGRAIAAGASIVNRRSAGLAAIPELADVVRADRRPPWVVMHNDRPRPRPGFITTARAWTNRIVGEVERFPGRAHRAWATSRGMAFDQPHGRSPALTSPRPPGSDDRGPARSARPCNGPGPPDPPPRGQPQGLSSAALNRAARGRGAPAGRKPLGPAPGLRRGGGRPRPARTHDVAGRPPTSSSPSRAALRGGEGEVESGLWRPGRACAGTNSVSDVAAR